LDLGREEKRKENGKGYEGKASGIEEKERKG